MKKLVVLFFLFFLNMTLFCVKSSIISDNVLIDTRENPIYLEISSFTANVNSSESIRLSWITEYEYNLQGFYILKSLTDNIDTAQTLNSSIINAFNTFIQQIYTFEDTDVQKDTPYYYWLKIVRSNNSFELYGPIVISIIKNEDIVNPNQMKSCLSVYPNPFVPETTIFIDVPKATLISLNIYNVKGQLIKQLINESKAKGQYAVKWSGTDDNGLKVASGLYLCRYSYQGKNATSKIILLK